MRFTSPIPHLCIERHWAALSYVRRGPGERTTAHSLAGSELPSDQSSLGICGSEQEATEA